MHVTWAGRDAARRHDNSNLTVSASSAHRTDKSSELLEIPGPQTGPKTIWLPLERNETGEALPLGLEWPQHICQIRRSLSSVGGTLCKTPRCPIFGELGLTPCCAQQGPDFYRKGGTDGSCHATIVADTVRFTQYA